MNVLKWVVALLVVVVVAAILVGYKMSAIQAEIEASTSLPEYAETVEASSVEYAFHTPAVQVLGQVVAPQQVVLRNELAGTIQAVKFVSGERVSRGQVLIQMDISEERARLRSAKARADLASATNKRISSLRLANAVSQERQDQTAAELQVAEAEIALLQAMIAKKTLRAPFDAVAGIHQFEAGQYLAESTHITTLIGLQDYLWVDFRLPQFYSSLQVGSKVQIALVKQTGQVKGEQRMEAEIIARNSTVSSEARTLRYRARLSGAGTTLLPNTIVSVRVPTGLKEQKLSVPSTAVLHSSAGTYVYKLLEDKEAGGYRAKRQPVTIGAQEGRQAFVEKGLAVGELIASEGAFKLSDGLLTFIAEPATALGSEAQMPAEASP